MPTAIAPKQDQPSLGIGVIIMAQLFLSTIDPSAKWLQSAGLPLSEIIFVRYGVHLVIALVVFLPTRGMALLHSRALGLELARAAALFASTLTNFNAVRFLPVTMTSSILNTTPLLVCVLSIPLLGERVGWRRWMAIIVGLAGVLIIIRPGSAEFTPAVFLSLGGALLGAIYNILIRRLAGIDSAATQQVYACALALVCVLPFAFSGWVWPRDPHTWFAFALIGITGLLGHQCATVAGRFAPASALAPFSYLQIVFSSLISWLVFAQPPTSWIFAGAAVIIGSGLFLLLRERQLGKPAQVLVED